MGGEEKPPGQGLDTLPTQSQIRPNLGGAEVTAARPIVDELLEVSDAHTTRTPSQNTNTLLDNNNILSNSYDDCEYREIDADYIEPITLSFQLLYSDIKQYSISVGDDFYEDIKKLMPPLSQEIQHVENDKPVFFVRIKGFVYPLKRKMLKHDDLRSLICLLMQLLDSPSPSLIPIIVSCRDELSTTYFVVKRKDADVDWKMGMLLDGGLFDPEYIPLHKEYVLCEIDITLLMTTNEIFNFNKNQTKTIFISNKKLSSEGAKNIEKYLSYKKQVLNCDLLSSAHPMNNPYYLFENDEMICEKFKCMKHSLLSTVDRLIGDPLILSYTNESTTVCFFVKYEDATFKEYREKVYGG